MTREHAKKVVLVLIKAGKLPVPTFDPQNPEKWAEEMAICLRKYEDWLVSAKEYEE